MWLWSVLTTAMLTLKALASGAVESAFHLSFGSLAMWAFLHVKRYNTVRADLDSPFGGMNNVADKRKPADGVYPLAGKLR